MKRISQSIAVAAVCLTAVPHSALAWNDEGHRVVALIAESRLTPAARSMVKYLLDSDEAPEAMSNASVWADQIKRKRPETRPWHYVNIELGSTGYDRSRDCPGDDCLVEALRRQVGTLRTANASKPDRAEALKFIIHFVGDLHQPLHCADNHDRGGNEIKVTLGEKHSNLHSVWDADVVQALGRKPSQVATMLEAQISDKDATVWMGPAANNVEQLATETYRIAQSSVYVGALSHGPSGEVITLPKDYAQAYSALAATQIEKAGLRLAAFLNANLR